MIFEALNSLTEQAYTDSVSEIGPSTNRDHLLPLPTRLIEGIDFHLSTKKSFFQTMQPENLHRGHRSRWGRAPGCMDHTPGAAKRTAPRKVWSSKTPWSRCYAEFETSKNSAACCHTMCESLPRLALRVYGKYLFYYDNPQN